MACSNPPCCGEPGGGTVCLHVTVDDYYMTCQPGFLGKHHYLSGTRGGVVPAAVAEGQPHSEVYTYGVAPGDPLRAVGGWQSPLFIKIYSHPDTLDWVARVGVFGKRDRMACSANVPLLYLSAPFVADGYWYYEVVVGDYEDALTPDILDFATLANPGTLGEDDKFFVDGIAIEEAAAAANCTAQPAGCTHSYWPYGQVNIDDFFALFDWNYPIDVRPYECCMAGSVTISDTPVNVEDCPPETDCEAIAGTYDVIWNDTGYEQSLMVPIGVSEAPQLVFFREGRNNKVAAVGSALPGWLTTVDTSSTGNGTNPGGDSTNAGIYRTAGDCPCTRDNAICYPGDADVIDLGTGWLSSMPFPLNFAFGEGECTCCESTATVTDWGEDCDAIDGTFTTCGGITAGNCLEVNFNRICFDPEQITEVPRRVYAKLNYLTCTYHGVNGETEVTGVVVDNVITLTVIVGSVTKVYEVTLPAVINEGDEIEVANPDAYDPEDEVWWKSLTLRFRRANGESCDQANVENGGDTCQLCGDGTVAIKMWWGRVENAVGAAVISALQDIRLHWTSKCTWYSQPQVICEDGGSSYVPMLTITQEACVITVTLTVTESGSGHWVKYKRTFNTQASEFRCSGWSYRLLYDSRSAPGDLSELPDTSSFFLWQGFLEDYPEPEWDDYIFLPPVLNFHIPDCGVTLALDYYADETEPPGLGYRFNDLTLGISGSALMPCGDMSPGAPYLSGGYAQIKPIIWLLFSSPFCVTITWRLYFWNYDTSEYVELYGNTHVDYNFHLCAPSTINLMPDIDIEAANPCLL